MAWIKDAKPLSTLAVNAGAAAFARYGFTEQALIARWAEIAGGVLGRMSLPIRLTFPRGERRDGTLRIMAESGAALELQHLAPQLIERINGTFGYPAVAHLSIVQGPVGLAQAPEQKTKPLSAEEESALLRTLDGIQDPALKESLMRLGRALYERAPR